MPRIIHYCYNFGLAIEHHQLANHIVIIIELDDWLSRESVRIGA
jgi:hypothetical protein